MSCFVWFYKIGLITALLARIVVKSLFLKKLFFDAQKKATNGSLFLGVQKKFLQKKLATKSRISFKKKVLC